MEWATSGKSSVSVTASERWALSIWLLLVCIILGRGWLTPATHSVYPIYVQAAHDWLAGAALYGDVHAREGLDAFRYPPPLAVLFVPFTFVPNNLGGLCWRLLCLAPYLGGFVGLCRAFWPRQWESSGGFRGLLFIGLVPLSIASLNNAQANMLVSGLLLAGGTLLLRGRDKSAGLCLALAAVIKVYPAAVALLFLAIFFRRLTVPFLAALVALVGLPFLCQRPEYVMAQYQHWWVSTFTELPMHNLVQWSKCDLASLLHLLRIAPSPEIYRCLQAILGIGVAGVIVWRRWRGCSAPELVRTTLDLGCCWMVLLGPFTESCTYILVAPTLAWALAASWYGPRLRLFWLLVILSCFLVAMLDKSLGLGRGQVSMAAFLYPLGASLLFVERLMSSGIAMRNEELENKK